MRRISSMAGMSSACRKVIASGKTLALVPTMGYLHEGHLSLVRIAQKKADVVVVSIFVNPTQFGPGEDFESYPQNTRADLAALREFDIDFVFTPDRRAIYPENFQTYVNVALLTRTLEGKTRPDHFRGVATIVTKLFNICRPDFAVFGQKDYQQAEVLRKMSEDLGYPIKIVIGPTLRESDGLAMSSRNSYFTPSQRREAVCLYRGLQAARKEFRSGNRSASELKRIVRTRARKICRGRALDFDYVALTDRHTLTPLKKAQKGAVLSVAARVHGVRLIDNIIL
ncbi:MAG: pantoate--beta-alanine ligase [candidate division Zixibacteria bacterium]|nr:pantoate--beta-alanine ligase [candidate division Zixibacteria bacterium]